MVRTRHRVCGECWLPSAQLLDDHTARDRLFNELIRFKLGDLGRSELARCGCGNRCDDHVRHRGEGVTLRDVDQRLL
ncbi:hypothetical protein EVAR_25875_1 [Eumeta japonica]|uniref:Uncharacterized protein n=1 Tax=Eumeta variegata TaxID=151549 RepID=A0A4C1X7E3_EUMVA|nr:hypothetical protein EVAR_25875_1 [Eumeta japonica]